MATVSLYRMPHSETSSFTTRRCKVTSGALAQLISKFEDCTSTTSDGQATLPLSSSLSCSQPSLSTSESLKMLPRLDTTTLQGANQIESKKCESNTVSPGQLTNPSTRQPTRTNPSSSDASEKQTSPDTAASYVCSRHLSVAERRKAFESGEDHSSAWTSARTSTDTSPPSKLAQSRSWQTIHTGSSFNLYLDGDRSSDSSSQPTLTGEEHQVDQNKFDYRSLLRRSKNVLSSAVPSRSRFKTMPDLTPRSLNKQMSPLSAISHSGWMKLDDKASKSFSSLKSSTISSYTLPLLSDQHQFKENTGGSTRQQPKITLKSEASHGVVQTKIATLRQIFDRPKAITAPSTASARTKRRSITPISLLSTPNKPRRLQKSATVQILGSTDCLTIKTRGPSIPDTVNSTSSQVPKSPSITPSKKESPLKEKIGLFESLAHDRRDGSPGSTRSKTITREKPFLQNYKRKISGVKKSFQIKGTLRRLSASWGTSSEDNEVCEVKGKGAVKPKDAWWMRRDLAVYKKTFGSQSSPRAETKLLAPRATNKEQSKKKETALKNNSRADRETTCIAKRWSFNDQGFNVDGPGVARHKGKQLFKHDNSPIPVALTLSNSKPYTMGNNANDRPLSPTGQKSHSLFRRRTSRSSGPLVANVSCKLEQPRPVRAGEMRRIISLCKDKVTRRLSGGGFE